MDADVCCRGSHSLENETPSQTGLDLSDIFFFFFYLSCTGNLDPGLWEPSVRWLENAVVSSWSTIFGWGSMLQAASKMLLLGHGTIEGKSSSSLSVAFSGVRQCLPTAPSRRPQGTPLSQASHWQDD